MAVEGWCEHDTPVSYHDGVPHGCGECDDERTGR